MEAEWYGATSTAIDGLCIKHCLAFILGKEDGCNMTVWVDNNSAAVELQARRFQDETCARQSHVAARHDASKEIAAEVHMQRAELGRFGNKGSGVQLLFKLGVRCKNGHVGEYEFQQAVSKQQNRQVVKNFCRQITAAEGISGVRPSACSSSWKIQMAKQFLDDICGRFACEVLRP